MKQHKINASRRYRIAANSAQQLMKAGKILRLLFVVFYLSLVAYLAMITLKW